MHISANRVTWTSHDFRTGTQSHLPQGGGFIAKFKKQLRQPKALKKTKDYSGVMKPFAKTYHCLRANAFNRDKAKLSLRNSNIKCHLIKGKITDAFLLICKKEGGLK